MASEPNPAETQAIIAKLNALYAKDPAGFHNIINPTTVDNLNNSTDKGHGSQTNLVANTPDEAYLLQELSTGFGKDYPSTYNGMDTFGKIFTGLTAGLVSGGLAAPVGAAVGGGLAGAAAGGAAAGALNAGLTGNNIGKGALTGALGGAFTNVAAPAVRNSLGLTNNTLGNSVSRGLVGAATGAVRGAVSGQGAGVGALAGGVGGAVSPLSQSTAQGLTASGVNSTLANTLANAAGGAITGAVTGSGAGAGALKGGANAVTGSIFNNGNAAVPTTQSNNNMADDYSALDPNYFSGAGNLGSGLDTGYGSYTGNPGLDNSGPNYLNNFDVTGGIDQNYLSQLQQTLGNAGGGNGSPATPSSSGSSSILGGLLSKLLPSGSSPQNTQLLAQLLGLGSAGLGGFLQQNNARTAANQFTTNTQYTPTNVTTTGGTSTLGPNGATTTLSPGQAGIQTGLTGLANSALGKLNQSPTSAGGYTGINNPLYAQFTASQNGMKGYNPQNFSFNAPTSVDPNQIYNDTFKQLQDQSRDSNNKFYQSNLDNQFANGVLSSTAGQYQSQAALDAINKQTTQNQLTARQFADDTVNNNLNTNAQAFGQQLGVNQTNNNNSLASVGVNNQNVQQALANALGLFQTGNTASNNAQQQQLLALTGALTGNSSLNQQQLQQLLAGNAISGTRSGINLAANQPSIAPNSASAWGSILSNLGSNVLGNTASTQNNSLAQLLQQIGYKG